MSEDTKEWLAREVLRLGNEVRDRSKERNALKEHIKYLEIELKCETGRWERTMEENARLKAEVERLISVSEAWKKRRLDKVEAECIKWSDYEKLKAEVERLRASSFVTAVPIEQYERVIKAGDAIAICLCGGTTEDYNKRCALNWLAAKEGKQS